ncbi:MAG: glycerate kinase [Lachnospiraceae bacterium]|nr:glycerate kinase [Lachnospiraceae bacterium]
MKLVFASDSFKGSLSSKQIVDLLKKASNEVFGECDAVPLILADGGEGTLDAVLSVMPGRKISEAVHGPLMQPVNACYGSFAGGRALVEMAQASGLTLIAPAMRDPMVTTSIGTGELIREALRAQHKDITVAIGGSATNDGGLGALSALGIRFTDKDGKLLAGSGKDLSGVSHIDMSGMMPELKDAHFTVMCDVTNPLCGPSGASLVFGPQKGADPEKVRLLEEGMQNFREVIIRTFGTDPDIIPGAGAAGGMGAALKIFLGAELKSGIDTMLDLCDFDSLIKDADLVITGEGRLDVQSSGGKAVQGVAERAKRAGIPCMAICGCLGSGYELIKESGIADIVTLTDENTSPEYAMQHAEELYYKRAIDVMRGMR